MNNPPKKELSVNAIENGTVIDHIPGETTLKVVEIVSNPDDMMTIGVNLPSRSLSKKGFVKISNRFLTDEETSKIALIAPTAKVNIIKNYKIVSKSIVHLPAQIKGLVKCNNPICITNKEIMVTVFDVLKPTPLKMRCHYCERTMGSKELHLL
jgi:aspartate carbamoyltransferase regulatory subunit